MAITESAAAKWLGSGVAAALLAALGVEPQALVWGLIGATLGLSLAPKDASRLRSVCIFACVVLAAALIGTVAAEHFGRGPIWRNVIAMLTASAFHPLFTALIAQVPAIVLAARRRFGLGDQP